jgi:ArsR family transcriptional regulator, arsenate/arsenite/antimonite-responsive transcriptional repressor
MYADDLRGVLMTARPSPSVEVDWALSGALRVARETQPALWAFYEQHPKLAERVRRLWGPEETLSYPCFLELSALAYGSGLLFGLDTQTFVSRLGELCLNAPEDLAFAAETPDDRSRLNRRLHSLRSDEAVRDRYVEVVSEVWNGIRDIWESEGRAAVDAAVTEFLLSLRGQSDPAELALKHLEQNACTNISREDMTRLIEGLGESGELVFVPAFFTAKGLVTDLPGIMIIGMPAKPVAAAARARTESLARRLKAIADPTRLAILDALMQHDMSITDVTNLFGLAQPTVSNHVKQLRDAGVVTSSNEGRRRRLTVRREVVSEIISALDEIFDLEENRV